MSSLLRCLAALAGAALLLLPAAGGAVRRGAIHPTRLTHSVVPFTTPGAGFLRAAVRRSSAENGSSRRGTTSGRAGPRGVVATAAAFLHAPAASPFAVQVTPDGGDSLRVSAGTYVTVPFTVTNTGTTAASFAVSPYCVA